MSYFVSRSLLTALGGRPVAILIGNSDTGEAKLAELLARWLCGSSSRQYAVVPVGADWTDNRNVLGFVNYISFFFKQKTAYEITLPIYQSTPVLDLLLAAHVD